LNHTEIGEELIG